MTSPTPQQLAAAFNQKLVEAFEDLLLVPYLAGVRGDSADNTIRARLEHKLGRAIKSVPKVRWSEDAEYADARAAVAEKRFEFSSTFDTPFIVDKPNGSQRWPDLLLVYLNRGLPLEVKSSTNGQVAWNSGGGNRIAPAGIYIYNGRKPTGRAGDGVGETTFFLGEHAISAEESRILELADNANRDVAKHFNSLLEDKRSLWSLYARPMFTCRDNVLTNTGRAARERAVLDLIAGFDWTAVRAALQSSPQGAEVLPLPDSE